MEVAVLNWKNKQGKKITILQTYIFDKLKPLPVLY